MEKIITKIDIEKTVVIRNGIEVVRSDNLGKMFDRTHKQVLALISKKIKFMEENNISLREYFHEEIATKVQGGSFTRYYLTRKGFDYIALSLRGKKAELHKLWYIDCFHDKQRVIEEHQLTSKLNHQDKTWLPYREATKEARLELTDAINATVLVEREKEGKFNDGKYYTHYTNLIYKKLGIILPKGTNARDILDKKLLARLTALEYDVADMILDSDKHYKETYQLIKMQLLNT